jgi:bis(5'-adenosyl)-triphosphatase
MEIFVYSFFFFLNNLIHHDQRVINLLRTVPYVLVATILLDPRFRHDYYLFFDTRVASRMQKQRSAVFVSTLILVLLIGFASAFHPLFTRQQPSGAAVAFAGSVSVSATDNANSMADTTPQEKAADNEKNNNNSCDNTTGDMLFGRFVIPEASVFCRSTRAAAFVNLRPIVPGHVLVVPQTIVPHMADLEEADYTALWSLVRKVQTALKKAYPDTTAFNVAVQDGKAAGQSVPHVHVHILPRSGGDFERNDDVYDALEAWSPTEAMAISKKSTDIAVPDDSDRIDRTTQQMADEAAMYRRLLEDLE